MEEANTVTKRLKYWADKHPEEEAFVFIGDGGRRSSLTCIQVYQQCQEFGRHLYKIGLRPGDVVCSMVPDSPRGLVVFFGIMNAGCIVLNPTLQMTDATFLLQNLQKAKCRALVLDSNPDNPATKVLSQYYDVIDGHEVTSSSLPDLKHVIITQPEIGTSDELGFLWHHTLEPGEACIEVDQATGDRGVIIVASSGTTGMSKLILHGQKVFLNVDLFGKTVSSSKRPVDGRLNLFEAHSLTWGWGVPLWFMDTGYKIIYLDQRYPTTSESAQIKLIRDTIISENCQVGKISAAVCLQLLELSPSKDTKPENWPLETVYITGQPLTTHIMKVVGPVLDRLLNVYGSSELSVVSMKEITEDTKDFEDFDAGSVIDEVDMLVVDDDLKPVGVREFGQILVKTPWMFQGYYGDEELTRSMFTKDGWFRTGDFGSLTENGALIVQGRYGDVIMRGIHYFHPSWIESIIRKCPGVADVVVVKVPDQILLNEICACFTRDVSSATDTTPKVGAAAETVRAFCEKEFVSTDSKTTTACPKYFLKVESFPLNNNGKVIRGQLEKKAAELLQLI